MDAKDKPLDDFLRALRISLNYISLYSREHRAFLKSCEQLKQKFDDFLSGREYCEIGFSPETLVVGDKTLSGQNLYKELARIFHSRKIKSVRIGRGASREELGALLEVISLPVRELLKKGGVNKILDAGAIPHCSVEELDYSLLLRDDGEETETSDIWSYLFKDAFDESGPPESGSADGTTAQGAGYRKIDEFLETFETTVSKLRGKDLVADEKLCQNVFRLLEYVRSKDSEKYSRILGQIITKVLQDKIIPGDARFDSLKQAIAEMPTEEISSLLWEEFLSDEQFDATSLELFSTLVPPEKNEQIADSLVKKAGKEHSHLVDPHQRMRVKKLFSLPGGPSFFPEIYKKAIRAISEESFFDRGFVFDRHKLAANFDRILLNLFMQEQDPSRRDSVIKAILASWDEAVTRRDLEYFRMISEVVLRVPAERRMGSFGRLESRFFQYIEEGVFDEGFPPELADLVETIEKSSIGTKRYMQEFFANGNLRPQALTLFFRLFPSSSEEFCSALSSRAGDMEFMSRLIDGLKTMDSGYSLFALKKIYSLTNAVIRVEVVKAMVDMKQYDRQFLFTVLSEGGPFLKKEALLAVKRDAEDLRHALDMLLFAPNPWGRNNSMLVENLSIVDELELGQAREHIAFLAKKWSLFARPVARKARQVMESSHV